MQSFPGAETIVAGRFSVDLSRALPEAGGGLPAFAAADRAGGPPLIAVQVRRGLPARARPIAVLADTPLSSVLLPVAFGAAEGQGAGQAFVICQAPPGRPVAIERPWPEAELIEHVLRPAAAALEALRQLGVTHRAIRPGNLFRAGPGQPVVLGTAWACPPALLQPAVFEPPYSAICVPAGRGDGTVADDVYALGVLLVALATGRVPMAGLDDDAILRRKLDLGSFAAIAGEERLSPAIADLVRGMVAEDPEHRPPPELLTQPALARSRRVAARPPRRAQRALEIGAQPVWNPRMLAFQLAREPETGLQHLQSGAVERWLRRSLGDAMLASQLNEAVHGPEADRNNQLPSFATRLASDSEAPEGLRTVMRAIAVLDPLAPLCWRGVAIWPDGLGPAVAEALSAPDGKVAELTELVLGQVAAEWGAIRSHRCDAASLRLDARQQRSWVRQQGEGRGLARLCYALNPLEPCRSPALEGGWVVRPAELLLALEQAAARPGARSAGLLDAEMAALLVARIEHRLEADPGALADAPDTAIAALAQLRLLAALQARFHPAPLPGLAGWMAERLRPVIETWANRTRRKRIQAELPQLAGAGRLPAMLILLDDAAAREADASGARDAVVAVRRIDRELQALSAGGAQRMAEARRIGQEVAAGAGLAAAAIMLVAAALA